MLRAILALLFAILYQIIGIPVLGIEWIISKFNRKAADISQLRMVQWAFRVILFICGTKVTVIGEENVPKDEAVLYIGNHKSYFDIIITYARLGSKLHPVTEEEKAYREKLLILPESEKVIKDYKIDKVFGYLLIAAGIAVTLFLLFGWALPYNGII